MDELPVRTRDVPPVYSGWMTVEFRTYPIAFFQDRSEPPGYSKGIGCPWIQG